MASSDNLITIDQPWISRSAFINPWLSESFARDTETLTEALQNSISNHSDNLPGYILYPFLHQPENTSTTTATQLQTPTTTVSAGSDSELALSNRRKITGVGVNGGKVTKRKSRASKKTTTTYIAADVASFRQMVQQVTGLKFCGDQKAPIVPVFKPEPQRLANSSMQNGFLPTLDTSAFLLDSVNQPPVCLASALVAQPPAAVSVPPPLQSLTETVDDGGSAAGFDFDFYCNFPILESNVI